MAHAGGRPSDYTLELVAQICVHVVDGKSLRAIAALDDMPALRTIMDWLERHAEFAQRYARAKEAQADLMAEDIIDLSDEAMNALTSEQAQAYRLRVDARKWVAAKLKPKKYGDRTAHEHSGPDGAPITVITSIPANPALDGNSG